MEQIKLNLGSGSQALVGYYNLDAKNGDCIFPLDVVQRSGPPACEKITHLVAADEIRASHVLEHFPHGQTQEILSHWVSKLKPGGILKIAVPDFDKIITVYSNGMPIDGYVMGGQSDEYDYHKALFNERSLRAQMEAAGLVDIKPWTSEIADCASLPVSLNLMGMKPYEAQGVGGDSFTAVKADGSIYKLDQPEPEPDGGKTATDCQSKFPANLSRFPDQPEQVSANGRRVVPDKPASKVVAVMSVPRLCFTNNIACIFRTIAQCGIPCSPGQGVFWHHSLTRGFEDGIAGGYEFLLAIDFDTWFMPGHVTRLIELLTDNPQADAICGVQCQREAILPILGILDDQGQPMVKIPRAWFEQPLTRIHVGHFGLTLFRASAFAKLKRPWFRDEPDPNGSYRDGRTDADVAFWLNFNKCGCQLFMANEVNIGHLQEVCTFPGPAAVNWKPSHVYMRDLYAGQMPAHCNPAWRITTQQGQPQG